jgi:hypothetical protein
MSLPQLGRALRGWKYKISLIKIVSNIDSNGYKTITKSVVNFQGVIQPLKGEQLQAKPLDMRSYRWLQIHTLTDKELSTGDQIEYNNTVYKVVDIFDYSLNKYIEYHCVELLT